VETVKVTAYLKAPPSVSFTPLFSLTMPSLSILKISAVSLLMQIFAFVSPVSTFPTGAPFSFKGMR
jgi:hypothetical protein